MTGYICDGVKYLTESRDVKRKTQNSGIMLKAITQSDDKPIIEHKEGHMELWPEQQLDDTTFETEEDIEWVREGVPRLEIDPETLKRFITSEELR
ncbi:hypothetical protein KY284_036188 [Solanum tuberosum]|nr:hypothetical protein KY284_036188 [Solanum tuberosum]